MVSFAWTFSAGKASCQACMVFQAAADRRQILCGHLALPGTCSGHSITLQVARRWRGCLGMLMNEDVRAFIVVAGLHLEGLLLPLHCCQFFRSMTRTGVRLCGGGLALRSVRQIPDASCLLLMRESRVVLFLTPLATTRRYVVRVLASSCAMIPFATHWLGAVSKQAPIPAAKRGSAERLVSADVAASRAQLAWMFGRLGLWILPTSSLMLLSSTLQATTSSRSLPPRRRLLQTKLSEASGASTHFLQVAALSHLASKLGAA